MQQDKETNSKSQSCALILLCHFYWELLCRTTLLSIEYQSVLKEKSRGHIFSWLKVVVTVYLVTARQRMDSSTMCCMCYYIIQKCIQQQHSKSCDNSSYLWEMWIQCSRYHEILQLSTTFCVISELVNVFHIFLCSAIQVWFYKTVFCIFYHFS